VRREDALKMAVRDLLHDAFDAATRDERLRVALPSRMGNESRRDARTVLLKGLSSTMRMSRGVKSGAAKKAGSALPVSTKQRVIVKALVSRHGATAAAKGALKAHVSYLQRDGAGADGAKAEAFTAQEEAIDASAHVAAWADDRHHFRFIISPEHGDQITDMRGYVREVMARAGADLGEARLDWLAVVHTNTDQPHAHVMVRGRRENGRDLVIARAYVSYGLRGRAQEVAQERLGEVSREAGEKRLAREAEADRYTALDRELERHVDEKGLIARRGDLARSDAYGCLMRRRLAHLERLRLADRGRGGWQLAERWQSRLRAIEAERDVISQIHARRREGVRDIRPLEARDVAGKVVASGRHDELGQRPFVIVRDAAGAEHYAALPASDGPPALGNAARLRMTVAGRAQVFDLGKPNAQLGADRLTPLDRELGHRIRSRDAGREVAHFDSETEAAIDQRMARHLERGDMAIGVAGPAFTPRGWARLRDRDVALCVREQLGADKPFTGVAHAQIEGAYVGAVQTQSGMYAVVDRGASLSAMRVAEAPGLQIGAQVALTPGANGVAAGIDAGVGLEWKG
jgi:hypothetical protein